MIKHQPEVTDDHYYPHDPMLLLMGEHSPNTDKSLLTLLNTSLAKIEGVSTNNIETIINAFPKLDTTTPVDSMLSSQDEWEEFDMNNIDQYVFSLIIA